MKIAVLIGDGMGDYPIAALGGRTPLQAAAIPNLRAVAAAGAVRQVLTVPPGMPPGSDVANLSIMGFDPAACYTGRAPIEAAGAGLAMTAEDVAFRCNLITVADGLIQDHSAGHISTEEARPLVEALGRRLGGAGRRFSVSAGYRHLLLWASGPLDLQTTPPHDVLGQPVARHLPRGPRSAELLDLMDASKAILADHPATAARARAGQRVPTQIWLWGQGRRTVLPPFRERFGLAGAVISAVDLVRGIGRLAGLEAVRVPGATGFLDTNYAGKVAAARAVLAAQDFVFVHVEAPDECGHLGDWKLKLDAIEAFDREIVGPLFRHLQERGRPYRLIVGTDHRTPVSVRNHTAEPVPMAVLDGPVPAALSGAAAGAYDETANAGMPPEMAHAWLGRLLAAPHGAGR